VSQGGPDSHMITLPVPPTFYRSPGKSALAGVGLPVLERR
jgi:hypothetical protein